jgi:hypothetical protein
MGIHRRLTRSAHGAAFAQVLAMMVAAPAAPKRTR